MVVFEFSGQRDVSAVYGFVLARVFVVNEGWEVLLWCETDNDNNNHDNNENYNHDKTNNNNDNNKDDNYNHHHHDKHNCDRFEFVFALFSLSLSLLLHTHFTPVLCHSHTLQIASSSSSARLGHACLPLSQHHSAVLFHTTRCSPIAPRGLVLHIQSPLHRRVRPHLTRTETAAI